MNLTPARYFALVSLASSQGEKYGLYNHKPSIGALAWLEEHGLVSNGKLTQEGNKALRDRWAFHAARDKLADMSWSLCGLFPLNTEAKRKKFYSTLRLVEMFLDHADRVMKADVSRAHKELAEAGQARMGRASAACKALAREIKGLITGV